MNVRQHYATAFLYFPAFKGRSPRRRGSAISSIPKLMSDQQPGAQAPEDAGPRAIEQLAEVEQNAADYMTHLVALSSFTNSSVLDARLMSSHGGRLYPEERTASADGKSFSHFHILTCR